MHGGFLLLVFASICIAHLHAAVFNVDVKHPSAAQKHQAAKWHQHLHRDHLARSQLAKQGNSKELRKYLAMVSAKKLGEEHENLNDGESAEIEDLEVDENSNRHWMNPSGTIKLGIPPQDFIVAFSVASPDTFVASSGSVDWANFLTFNENKSYTFTDVNSTFQDSLFLNSNKRSCEPRNTGRVGKDLITLGNLVLPLKFGLVDNVNKTKCMDWQDSGVEGMFGLSLAKSANDMPSTLEQVAPILDEPAFSVLTISDEDKNEAEYHLKIGSTNIEGHCAAKDYTFFPSTSANVADENKDGFHTQLWRIELKYPNGSFARWNLPPKTEMEFTKLVTEDLVWNSPYIYGDAQTVEEVAIQLGGAEDFLGYMAVPCNIHGQPEMIFTFGDAHNKVEWVVHPEEYTMTNPWLPFECVSLLQYSRYYGSWTSLEYHNQLCFAVKFGPEGNQIGLARPLESN